MKKYKERAGNKRFQEAGLLVAVESYNVYVATLLLYIAQLENPTEEVLKAEEGAIHSTIRGPGRTWLNYKDAWYLKENFGQAESIPKVFLGKERFLYNRTHPPKIALPDSDFQI